ncbi:MAG: D-alanyl-D-alanine carboxypeptidase [Actinobacteria bacterium]|nr:D-alanyl-D-alanine carboxypeptidase [Actinomycetota bacterium]
MIVRRTCRVAVAAVLVTATVVAGLPTRTAVADPAARASITFDVTTGRVIDAENDRTPVPVASTIKLLTALVAQANLSMDAEVPITQRIADTPPLKLSMAPGTRWRADDLMHAMLIASLNDTAMALALAAGHGTFAGYDKAAKAEMAKLQLADSPVIRDPSGLDGTEGVDGGNLISARDLAIVTREFLSIPSLAAIVQMRSYHFTGGDGRPHVVYTHNAFLSIYPGAIGVKTGYTDRSGHSLVAAATRQGRTLATIVIDSPDPVAFARAHLDAAFAAGPDTPGTGDVLPEPRPPTTTTIARAKASPVHPVATERPVDGASGDGWILAGILAAGCAVLATLVVRARRRARGGPTPSRFDRS